jgi:hypothetical protein
MNSACVSARVADKAECGGEWRTLADGRGKLGQLGRAMGYRSGWYAKTAFDSAANPWLITERLDGVVQLE